MRFIPEDPQIRRSSDEFIPQEPQIEAPNSSQELPQKDYKAPEDPPVDYDSSRPYYEYPIDY